jgi:general L-amino acid transport system substrate-binding protein
MSKRTLHLIWFWVVGSIFIMSCGALSTFVDTTVPTPQVIVVTSTPEATGDVEVDLNSETVDDATTVATEPTTEPSMPAPSKLIEVQSRGVLRCGVNADLPGFGFYDAVRKRWSGFDVDFCRVIAAAVLGDATKVEFIPVTTADGPNERFNAVRSGMVDVLIRNTTWTASRDGSGLAFGPTTFHDGQTFMVRKNLNIQSLDDLDGKRICAGEGTTSLLNLRDDFAARGIQFSLVETKGEEALYESYRDGLCDAVTSDSSQLAVERIELPEPDDHIVMGDRISREPLGPAVAEGDDQWFDIVSWSIYATMYAEELRIDNSNVNDFLIESTDPRVRRLLGIEGNIGQQFGLPADFGYQIISQVGSYADVYNKNLGPDTAFAIDRGPNKAWNLGGGGVLASPPFR